MKKYLVIILLLIFPCMVLAEDCTTISNKEYCIGSSCLTSLQSDYNTWNTTGNTGTTCIKVIAKINGTTKSYISGKNPEVDYKCSTGAVTSKLIASALANPSEVTDCNSEICYVPEIWQMTCGTSTGTSTGTGTSSATSSSSGVSSSSGTGTSTGTSDNVETNSNGQITGTTDTSDTGVETYFIVLLVMVIISYLVLVVFKKKNIFKSI